MLVLGISYKPNVKDIQLTPAETIIKKLQEKGATIKIYDPYFKSTKVFGIQTENDLESILSYVDGVILLTAHKEFLEITPSFLKSKMKHPVVIDSKNIIDQQLAKNAGLIYRGIGRGKI